MTRDTQDGSTRRRFLKAGTGLAVSGALAGCGQDGAGSTATGDGGDPTSSARDESTTGEGTDAATESASGESYAVSMEPVGTVELDGVPESWVPFTGDYADMGVALGQADGLEAIGVPERFGTHYYEELPDVSVDKESLTTLYQEGTGKEIFYEIGADVHVVDPNFMSNRLQWSRSDVEEVRRNVAPFFGNTIFTRVYDWHDYQHYSLYEAFEKVAQLFRQQERYDAFANLNEEVTASIRENLPDESLDVALLYPASIPPESFYPYLIGEGTASKQWRTLNVGDALAKNGIADAQAGGGTIDFETLLDIDPDAIAVRIQGNITEEYFRENVVRPLQQHDVASQLTAVQNDRVVYGGLTYQGPIIYLFQLEMAAQGLYPEAFGDEPLFDRRRVNDIVTGDF
ncbi:ABC transporter substrate-binding protein [Halogeometricum luteum]|uniref:ABC transporter substrate-binding protein n=1 Tax=Halogeometricum luteum TaxID=2950537 RepID=A0ABU2G3T2_9EURY|nr:ABC transporter substrate-binding protein [Halogeometricum sp. S3BR5-2]MDS0295443.1 ABC transporter substrate-binding protein [Halogeometricum sp. S3BR5-2]